MIPYKLFILLLGGLDAMDALDELKTARAVSLGEGLHRGGQNGRIRSAVRSLTRRAYPGRED